MNEKELEGIVLNWLKGKGIFCWKAESQGTFDPTRGIYRKNPRKLKGVSDIIGILSPSGKMLAIELKKPVKNPRTQEQLRKIARPEQISFVDNVNENGGVAFFADCLETVIKHLWAH